MSASSARSAAARRATRSVTTPVAAGLFAILAFVGCAYVPLAPLGRELSASNLDPDEQALWKKSRELQYKIELSGLLFEDPELDAYLDQVLRRVSPPELASASLEPRVRVVSDVNIHAYSFANGVIYIHTALLSRMTDETQLATVLSRELAHVVNRHALRAQRDKRVQADTLAWIGLGGSLVQGGDQLKLLAQAASITSVVGFHHSLETAADRKGLASLAAAGYDVRETPAFYEMTLSYLAGVHQQGVWGWTSFTPPPQITARIAGYEALIASEYANQAAISGPTLDASGFRRKMHRATLRQCDLELAAGLFVTAEECARLATQSDPRDAAAWTLLGKALSGQRAKPIPGRAVPSIRKVREAYGEALAIDRRNAEATRELGMSFYRTTGSTRSPEARTQALRHLRRYLTLAPGSGDLDYVRGYVNELEAESN